MKNTITRLSKNFFTKFLVTKDKQVQVNKQVIRQSMILANAKNA